MSRLTEIREAEARSHTAAYETLELYAPDQRQAVRLGRLFERNAEIIYNQTMTTLLEDEEELDG